MASLANRGVSFCQHRRSSCDEVRANPPVKGELDAACQASAVSPFWRLFVDRQAQPCPDRPAGAPSGEPGECSRLLHERDERCGRPSSAIRHALCAGSPRCGSSSSRPAADASQVRARARWRARASRTSSRDATRRSRGRAEPRRLPGGRLPVAVRRNARRLVSGRRDTRDRRDHARRDRHRRRPGRTGSRSQSAAGLQRARAERRRLRPERPRHLCRVARRGLELERRRHRGQSPAMPV